MLSRANSLSGANPINHCVNYAQLYKTLCIASSCRSSNNSEKIAEVDGTAITRTEVERTAGKSISGLREQLYRLERQKLDEYIGAMLLTREAKDRGVSASTLLEQEVNGKIPPISEEEIQGFYNSHKDRLAVGLDKV